MTSSREHWISARYFGTIRECLSLEFLFRRNLKRGNNEIYAQKNLSELS